MRMSPTSKLRGIALLDSDDYFPGRERYTRKPAWSKISDCIFLWNNRATDTISYNLVNDCRHDRDAVF